MKKYLVFFLILSAAAQAQQVAPLTVQKIMRDPKWMGVAPTNYRWSDDSKTVFFSWNPENKEKDQAYKVSVLTNKPETTEDTAAEKAAGTVYTYNKDKSLGLFEKGGDVYLYNFKQKKEIRLTNTVDREIGSKFLYNNDIVFQRGDNLFQVSLSTAETKQLTNFVKGKRPGIGGPAVPG
ncbi:MAG: S9 family peptidase, partial [Acinetobacter sp.]